MGTINYATSQYITIGLQPFDPADFIDDDGNINYYAMNDEYEWEMDEVQEILNRYNFYYFHVTIDPGYYEGFTIQIESNFGLCYDSWQDKREAQKEVTQLKQFLLECVEHGMCEVWPGRCTSYKTRDESIKAIREAMKEARQDIKNTPTWDYCETHGIEI